MVKMSIFLRLFIFPYNQTCMVLSEAPVTREGSAQLRAPGLAPRIPKMTLGELSYDYKCL